MNEKTRGQITVCIQQMAVVAEQLELVKQAQESSEIGRVLEDDADVAKVTENLRALEIRIAFATGAEATYRRMKEQVDEHAGKVVELEKSVDQLNEALHKDLDRKAG